MVLRQRDRGRVSSPLGRVRRVDTQRQTYVSIPPHPDPGQRPLAPYGMRARGFRWARSVLAALALTVTFFRGHRCPHHLAEDALAPSPFVLGDVVAFL